MKTQKTLLMVLLVVSLTIITSQVYAGFSIRLEKDVRSSNIPAWPNEITFDLYDSETAPD